MKKRIFIAFTLALSLILAACLFSCGGQNDDSGTVTVVIDGDGVFESYEIDISELDITDGVLTLVKYLADEEGLDLDYSNSSYGAYINSIGGLVPNMMAGEYIGVFTSVEADFDVSTMFSEMTYRGEKLGTSGVGISSMTVKSGATYLFTVLTYTG